VSVASADEDVDQRTFGLATRRGVASPRVRRDGQWAGGAGVAQQLRHARRGRPAGARVGALPRWGRWPDPCSSWWRSGAFLTSRSSG